MARSAQSTSYIHEQINYFFSVNSTVRVQCVAPLSFRSSSANTQAFAHALPSAWNTLSSLFICWFPQVAISNAASPKLSSFTTQFRVDSPGLPLISTSPSLYVWTKVFIIFFSYLFDVYLPPLHYAINGINAGHSHVAHPLILSTWNDT